MPVAIAKMFGSKMMSSGGKPTSLRQQVVAALADLDLALEGVGLALLVEGHHDHRRAVAAHELARWRRNSSSPSFSEIELTIALPCTHFRPGLDHLHFERVDHHRHARDVRLGGDQVQERHHRRLRVEHRLVHVDVDDLRAVLHLLARDSTAPRRSRRRGSARERVRAGDVGALADVDEQRVVADVERLEAGEAQLVLDLRGTLRGGKPRTASAIAVMCAGVVPQQPPTMLTKPFSRELARCSREVCSGVSS